MIFNHIQNVSFSTFLGTTLYLFNLQEKILDRLLKDPRSSKIFFIVI